MRPNTMLDPPGTLNMYAVLHFPGTPGCSLYMIFVRFTFEQYSGCTHILYQMSTLSYLAYKRDLYGTI